MIATILTLLGSGFEVPVDGEVELVGALHVRVMCAVEDIALTILPGAAHTCIMRARLPLVDLLEYFAIYAVIPPPRE